MENVTINEYANHLKSKLLHISLMLDDLEDKDVETMIMTLSFISGALRSASLVTRVQADKLEYNKKGVDDEEGK